MFKECIFLLCLLSIGSGAPDTQPIEANAAAVAEKIVPEHDKSSEQDSDLETAEFKNFGQRKFGYAAPVAPVYVQPVAPVYVQPVAPVYVQPVQYQQPVYYKKLHVHTPDCGCNGGYNSGQSYGYNYNYNYNY